MQTISSHVCGNEAHISWEGPWDTYSRVCGDQNRYFKQSSNVSLTLTVDLAPKPNQSINVRRAKRKLNRKSGFEFNIYFGNYVERSSKESVREQQTINSCFVKYKQQVAGFLMGFLSSPEKHPLCVQDLLIGKLEVRKEITEKKRWLSHMSISLITAVLGRYLAWILTESVRPVNETQTTIFLATQWNYQKWFHCTTGMKTYIIF